MPRVKTRAIRSPTLNDEEVCDNLTVAQLVPGYVSTRIVTATPPIITSSMCLSAFLQKKEFPPQISLQVSSWDRVLSQAAISVSGVQTTDAVAPHHDQRWYKAYLLLRKSPTPPTRNHYSSFTIPGLPRAVFDRNPRTLLDELFAWSTKGTTVESRSSQISEQQNLALDGNYNSAARIPTDLPDAGRTRTLQQTEPDQTSVLTDEDVPPLREVGVDANPRPQEKGEPKDLPLQVSETTASSAAHWKGTKRKRHSPDLQLDKSILLRIEAEIYREMRPKRSKVGKPNYADDPSSPRTPPIVPTTTSAQLSLNSAKESFSATPGTMARPLIEFDEKTAVAPRTSRDGAASIEKTGAGLDMPSAGLHTDTRYLAVESKTESAEAEANDGGVYVPPLMTRKPTIGAAAPKIGQSTPNDDLLLLLSLNPDFMTALGDKTAVDADVFAPINNFPSAPGRRVARNHAASPPFPSTDLKKVSPLVPTKSAVTGNTSPVKSGTVS